MNIIIAGAGQVGIHLAKLLSREISDILLLDTDKTNIQVLSEKYNFMTYEGDPAQPGVLQDIGIENCKLFIAVTPHESLNITSCILASSLGAKKTVARVCKESYLLPKNREIFKKVGVDELIYPEQLAAQEIVTALKNPWAWQIEEFKGGLLKLAAIRVRENASILNIPLEDISEDNPFFHIVTIKRSGKTFIPVGSDKVIAGDIIYVTYLPKDETKLKNICGKEEHKVRNLMIAGATDIAHLTTKAAMGSFKVTILDHDAKRVSNLSKKLDNALIINSDPRYQDILKDEDIMDMDAFVALADSTEENILTCKTANDLGVKKTIVEVENIDYMQMAENLDMGTVINKKFVTASQIYHSLLKHKAIKVKCLTYADAEVVEIEAKLDSKVTKKTVKNLRLPSDIRLGGLIRGNKPILIHGDTQILPNDTVIVFIQGASFSKINKYFA